MSEIPATTTGGVIDKYCVCYWSVIGNCDEVIPLPLSHPMWLLGRHLDSSE